VIKRRLRRDISISKNQFGFMLARLTTEAIHLIGRLMELFKHRKHDLHTIFIDIEKAYDRVSHTMLWECLERK